MYRTIIDKTLLKSDATVGTTACTWDNVPGVLKPSGSTSENPDDYIFILNGVEYQCNYFLKGDTKFKAAYRTNNHDTIMLEYIISTELSNIKIRTDEGFDVLDSNTFKLLERIPDPEKYNSAIIRFSKDKAFIIDDTGSVKEV